MKIKCIANSGKDLPADCLRPVWGITENKEFAIVIGKTYVVYAFTFLLGYVWYYICDETYSFYPVWNPAPLFTISDHRLSRFWQFNHFIGNSADQTHMIVAFPEWANDRLYYDRLTSGVVEAVKVFEHYKTQIDNEVLR